MKYVLLALLLLPIAVAANYTDTLTTDFTGTVSQINTTNDALTLNSTNGTYAVLGTYTSRVFDLGSNPQANIRWTLATPSGTSVLVSTRSASDPNDAGSWSSWSTDYSTSTGSTITSPMRRYYQYRVQLITTNTSVTPTVNDVTITYTEQGTLISAASAYNGDLTSASIGNYALYINVSDTLNIINTSARYRFGSGSWNTVANFTWFASTVYSALIPSPSSWVTYANSTLNVEVTAVTTNGSVNYTQTTTVQELIEFINTAPTLDPIANYTLAQNQTLNITLTGADADALTPVITFRTNRSDITITSLSNTSARLVWTVGNEDVGVQNVTVTANDSLTTTTRWFIVNVTEINDAPTISTVSAITGYHGVRQTLTLTANDQDVGANITFSMTPAFFTIETTLVSGNTTATNGTYYGFANFTPADPEDGAHNVTFFVTDGYNTSNTTTTMTISYCGDAVCQTTYESANTCALDCANTARLDSIALVLPDRNCANTTMQVQAFNATNRFGCYYQGLVYNEQALCTPLDGVGLTLYERNASLLVSRQTTTTNSNGTADLLPVNAAEYKIVAKKDGFANTTTLVNVRSCTQDITIEHQDVTVEQPPLPPKRDKPQAEMPNEEEPGEVQQEAGLLSIVLFYFTVPLLLAMLLYGSIVFYDVNKDTLPWLLNMRILAYEQRNKYQPQLDALKTKTAPVVKPVAQSLYALYAFTLKPVVDKLKKKRQ